MYLVTHLFYCIVLERARVCFVFFVMFGVDAYATKWTP